VTIRNYYIDGKIKRTLRWTKPDGTLYTDSELHDLMLSAADSEQYEKAAAIRDELIKRNNDE